MLRGRVADALYGRTVAERAATLHESWCLGALHGSTTMRERAHRCVKVKSGKSVHMSHNFGCHGNQFGGNLCVTIVT